MNISLVISIAALVLTIPCSIIANMVTPKLRNWWAARSRQSLEARISTLQAELARGELLPAMTVTEEYIFMGIEYGVTLVQYALQLIVQLGMCFAAWFGKLGILSFLVMYTFVGLLLILNHSTYKRLMRLIVRYHRQHGPLERIGLQLTIKELTGKLAQLKGD